VVVRDWFEHGAIGTGVGSRVPDAKERGPKPPLFHHISLEQTVNVFG
jgi:hypothetical protein